MVLPVRRSGLSARGFGVVEASLQCPGVYVVPSACSSLLCSLQKGPSLQAERAKVHEDHVVMSL